MITLECDNCEQNFDVDDNLAGEKTACPACGDINRVPAIPQTERDTKPVPVEIAEGNSLAEERELELVRPAMFRAHPFKGLLVFGLAIGGIVLTLLALFSVVLAWLMWVGAIMAIIGILWWVKWWVHTHLWIKVVVSNKRTVKHEGIIRRHSTEVLHDHVRSVDIQQNFLQRIFKVGYIGIDSAGQDGIEIEIADIPGPHRVKEIIDRHRKM